MEIESDVPPELHKQARKELEALTAIDERNHERSEARRSAKQDDAPLEPPRAAKKTRKR